MLSNHDDGAYGQIVESEGRTVVTDWINGNWEALGTRLRLYADFPRMGTQRDRLLPGLVNETVLESRRGPLLFIVLRRCRFGRRPPG
jgi:hypothetical protein